MTEHGDAHALGSFERHLTLWVLLCMAAGIALGKAAPQFATALDAMAITVDGAPVISIPSRSACS